MRKNVYTCESGDPRRGKTKPYTVSGLANSYTVTVASCFTGILLCPVGFHILVASGNKVSPGVSAETHTGQSTTTLHTSRLSFLKIKPFCLDLQAVDRGGLSCRMMAMGCGCGSGCLAPAQRHPAPATKRHQNKPALATVG